MQDISKLRKSYERAELSETDSAADPFKQFEGWLQEAITAELPEPNAMTLATVGSDMRPSSRIVLIKDLDARGIVWFTNYNSRKGQQLAGNPFASLQFHWVELERVVRIEGRVEKVSDQESDDYYNSRPLDSRIGAWASPQSEVISDRTVLVTNVSRERYAWCSAAVEDVSRAILGRSHNLLRRTWTPAIENAPCWISDRSRST